MIARSWSVAAIAVGVLALLMFSGVLNPSSSHAAWDAITPSAPLGYDEFSRNLLLTLVAAVLLSLLKAVVITAVVLIPALILGQAITLSAHRKLSFGLKLLVDSIEAIPPVLWVLAIFAALREPRLLLVGLAFSLITLPTAIALTVGEIERLRGEPFVEIAYSLGLSEWKIATRHLLPTATAILMPFAFQVIGAALAVDGAVGIIGLGNRTDLDLGVFLLRGKENFYLHPVVLCATIVAYLLIYWGLSLASERVRDRHVAD